MESSDPDSEKINVSEDSLASFEDDFDVDVENEDDKNERDLYASHCESTEDIMAYAEEPLADEEWLKKYQAASEENKRLEQELQARLDGAVQVETWWVTEIHFAGGTVYCKLCKQTAVFLLSASLTVCMRVLQSYSLYIRSSMFA